MIKYVRGDLFESSADVVAHGVNCRGAFGSGIAGQFNKLFPVVRNAYFDKNDGERWFLGDIQPVTTDKFVVVNCATQDNYLPRNVRNVDYDAVRTCMVKLKNFCEVNNYTIAIPKIGAGLAGGDWNVIEQIINEVFSDKEILVYHLD